MNVLQSYKTLLQISLQMVEAAEQQEWDSLNLLQQRRAAMIAALAAQPPIQAEVAAVRDIIRQIQVHDATVLEHATVTREQIGSLIARFSQER